jgi:hypothetical protein
MHVKIKILKHIDKLLKRIAAKNNLKEQNNLKQKNLFKNLTVG